MRLRIWGFPVLRISGGLPDPIQPLDDPDETPEPPPSAADLGIVGNAEGNRRQRDRDREDLRARVDAETLQRLHTGLRAWDPDGTPAEAGEPAPVVERLDVEPELRPWDTAQAPPRDPAPRPGVRLAKTPHCDGRHGTRPDGEAGPCEWCDALTSQISALKDLERRSADLEKQVAELRAAADHIKHETRERQS